MIKRLVAFLQEEWYWMSGKGWSDMDEKHVKLLLAHDTLMHVCYGDAYHGPFLEECK